MPRVTATAAGPTINAVVTRRRDSSGSFTDRLLIIARTAAKISSVTGCPATRARTPAMTTTASSIDAVPVAASRSRSRPGSAPATAVRSSAHTAACTRAVSQPRRSAAPVFDAVRGSRLARSAGWTRRGASVTATDPEVKPTPPVWHRYVVLRLAGARLLDDRDRGAVRALLDADPVASCMVAARVELAGLDPWRLGGEMWGVGSRIDGLCFSGANLVPLHGNRHALRSFADRARRHGRACSSIVGRAELVLPLWQELSSHWSPPREVRGEQPLMVLAGPPVVAADPLVRPVRMDELDRYLPAAVAMFTEEVGVARVAELVHAGRAFARFDGDQVVFKAEIGALSRQVGQIQGVWVHPACRGHGLGTVGTAAVAGRLATMGRVSSLYVNGFNTVARKAYERIGFRQLASFATVLF